MAGERVIPILPCRDLFQSLAFYVALGFEVTYEQHAPYIYGGVRREDLHLHFSGNKHLAPDAETSHTALLLVPDVNGVHAAFAGGLKARFGRVPRRGIPRLGSVNTLSRDRRFNLLDPSGNRLIVVQEGAPAARPKVSTPLGRAVQRARLYAYSKDDPALAAQHLDEALALAGSEPNAVRFAAHVLRADSAAMLGDEGQRSVHLRLACAVPLNGDERADLAEDLARLAELEGLP